MSLSERRGNLKALIAGIYAGVCIPFEDNQPDGFIYPEEDVKEAVELLKKKWRKKARRMKIMSGEVAIFELETELEEIFGKKLI